MRGGIIALAGCSATGVTTAPLALRGVFLDDYGTVHQIDDTSWVQGGTTRYRVESWHAKPHFLLTRLVSEDAGVSERFVRFDWVDLPQGSEWRWAFCIMVWDAPTRERALEVPPADRSNPRSGCNNYPFTRMREYSPTR